MTNNKHKEIMDRFDEQFVVQKADGYLYVKVDIGKPNLDFTPKKVKNFISSTLTEQIEELERDIPLKIQEAIDAINEDAHLVIREPAGEIISKIVLSHIREQKEIIKKQ